jgi:hypothetical protein
VEVIDVDEGTVTTSHLSSTAALALKRKAGSGSVIQTMASSQKKVKVKVEAAEVELDKVQSCAVCFDKPREILFLLCSHLLACGACANSLWEKSRECPLCRKKIERRIRAMIS